MKHLTGLMVLAAIGNCLLGSPARADESKEPAARSGSAVQTAVSTGTAAPATPRAAQDTQGAADGSAGDRKPPAERAATPRSSDEQAPAGTSALAAGDSAGSRDPLAASVIDDATLANARGGADSHLNQNTSTGAVTGNVASELTTGPNTISEGSFTNSSGIPIVIQNSGNNVLIQNSTILNLQLESTK